MPRPVSPLTVKTGLGRTVNIVGYTTLHNEVGTFVVVIDTDGNQYLVGFGDNDSFLMTNGDFDVPGSEGDNFGSIPAAYSGEVVPKNNWNILFWLRDNTNMSFDNTPLYDPMGEDYIDPVYSCVDYLLYIDNAEHTIERHRVFNDGTYGNVHGDINCYGQTTGSQGGGEFCEVADLANLSQEEGDIGNAFDTLVLMLNRRFFYAYHELAVVTTAELERIMPNDGDFKYFRVDDSTGQYNDIVMKLFNEDGVFYSCGVYSTREEEYYQYRCNMYGDLYGSTMALEDIEEVTDRIIDMLGLRKSALESSDRLDVEYSVELPQLQELQRSDINDLRVSRNPLYVRTNLKTEDGLGAIVKITYTQAGFLATTCMREPAQEGQSPAVWAANVYGELGFIASSIAEGEEISNTFAEAYGIQQQDTAYVTRESINVTRQAVIIVPPRPVPPAPTIPPITVIDSDGHEVNIISRGDNVADDDGENSIVSVNDDNGKTYIIAMGNLHENTFVSDYGSLAILHEPAENINIICAASYSDKVPENNWHILYWLRDNYGITFNNGPAPLWFEDGIVIEDLSLSCIDNLIKQTFNSIEKDYCFYDNAVRGRTNGYIMCDGITRAYQTQNNQIELKPISILCEEIPTYERISAYWTLILDLVGASLPLKSITANGLYESTMYGDEILVRISDPTGVLDGFACITENDDGDINISLICSDEGAAGTNSYKVAKYDVYGMWAQDVNMTEQECASTLNAIITAINSELEEGGFINASNYITDGQHPNLTRQVTI